VSIFCSTTYSLLWYSVSLQSNGAKWPWIENLWNHAPK
jgi:hypothetical protein